MAYDVIWLRIFYLRQSSSLDYFLEPLLPGVTASELPDELGLWDHVAIWLTLASIGYKLSVSVVSVRLLILFSRRKALLPGIEAPQWRLRWSESEGRFLPLAETTAEGACEWSGAGGSRGRRGGRCELGFGVKRKLRSIRRRRALME